MGIFVKQGVLNSDGTVTDVIWDGYVSDVMKKLASGNGTIPGVQIGPAIPPLPGAAQLNLKDKKLFGDFHETWRPKYEAMVRGIDADGGYKLSEFSGAPIMDPTAMAKSLSANAPPLKLEDALAQMLVPASMIPEPAGVFFSNMGDKSFTEVEKLPEMTDQEFTAAVVAKEAESAAKFTEALEIPPLQPIPQVPDVKILELGYTEQYTNEVNSALSPALAYPAMIGPGLPDLAGAVLGSLTSPQDLPKKVMEAVGNQNAKVAPPSMETSTFEIAANSVFEEHRAKYTAAVMLAQNIGHGVIVDALSATPFDQFGFEIMREPEEVEAASALLPDPLSGRRYKILKIIEDYLGPPPNSYVSILENKAKFEEVTHWEPPATVKATISLKDEYQKAQIELGEARKQGASILAIAALTAKRDLLQKAYLGGAKLASEIQRNQPQVATTCNAFPPYVIARKLGMKPAEYMLNDVKIDFTISSGKVIENQPLQLIGGLDTMRRAGRLKGCWVDAMSGPDRSWDPNVGLPKPGDVLLLSMGNALVGDQTKINLTSLRETGGEPWDTDARHVGFLFDSYGTYTPEDPDYETYWLTADAGQGAVANGDQRVAYVNRPVVIPPVNNEIRIVIMGEQNHVTGERKKAYVAGWLNVDKLAIAEENEIF